MDRGKISIASDVLYATRGFEAVPKDDARHDVATGPPNPSSALIDAAMKQADPRTQSTRFRTNHSARVPVGILGVLVVILCVGSPETGATAEDTTTIDIGSGASPVAPAEFDLQGHWALVSDPTAQSGFALQHSGPPASDDQFTLAVHKRAFLKNAEISFRLKTNGGQSDWAGGVVLRLSSPQDYYLVQMNARREEIIFSRTKDGVSRKSLASMQT